MEQMQKQAEHVGTEILSDIITAVDFTRRPLLMKGDSGATYTADAVIIATGAQARWLGIPGEQRFNGRGVSARSEEHTSELQSLMRISYAVFCLKKNTTSNIKNKRHKTK